MDGGVCPQPGNEREPGWQSSGQGSVSSVGNETELVVRQPFGELRKHIHRVVEQGDTLAVLAIEADIQGDSQRFASPWRMEDKTKQDVLQRPTENRFGGCGADGITADSGAVHFASGLLVCGIVNGEEQCLVASSKTTDKIPCPAGKQFALQPGSGSEKIMVDVDALVPLLVGEGIHAGNGAPGGTEYPSGHKADTYDKGRLGENRFKHTHKSNKGPTRNNICNFCWICIY